MATDPFRVPRSYPSKPEVPSAGQLWRRVPVQQRLEAARAFWEDAEAVAQQAEVIQEMARLLKFRPKSMRALPIDRKVQHLASLVRLPDSVASQVLVTYHLTTKRPMMRTFLDAVGIAHEDGIIAEPRTLKPPPAKKLELAVKRLAERFPPQDVHLYLSTLLVQDVDVWGGLTALLPGVAAAESAPSTTP